MFDKILFVSAMLLALCGAYYSIIGIATLFSGAMLSVGIMACAIELAKICSVTFLYRYWNKTNKVMKNYMCIASIVLVMITSVGISAFLLAAYQKSSLEFKAGQERIVMVEGQKTYLTDKIAQAKSRIDTLNKMRALQESRMNESLTNAFLTRTPIQFKQLQDQTAEMIKTADANIGTEQQTIQKTTDDIAKLDQQVNEMKFASANKKDIRTFQFVADQFGTTLDKVAKWFIFTIIFVFDPMAIALILAYNVVTYHKPEEPKVELTKAEFFEKLPIVNPPEESTNSENKEKVEIVDSPSKEPVAENPVTSTSSSPSITQSKPQPRPSWLQ